MTVLRSLPAETTTPLQVLGVGDGVGLGEGLGLGVGEGLGLGVGEGVGLGEGDGVTSVTSAVSV